MTEVWGYEYFGRPEPLTIFGEAPGPGEPDKLPLTGCVLRIAKLIDVSPGDLRSLFAWQNLLGEWPGYGPGGGSKFPMTAARERAQAAIAAGAGQRVYLGRRVATAFDFQGEWLVWTDGQAVSPHPSGLSRWWNDTENVERARAFWLELVEGHRGSP